MSFLFNEELNRKFDLLPENIKSGIENNAAEIKTEEELDELVRRIISAETGKIL